MYYAISLKLDELNINLDFPLYTQHLMYFCSVRQSETRGAKRGGRWIVRTTQIPEESGLIPEEGIETEQPPPDG